MGIDYKESVMNDYGAMGGFGMGFGWIVPIFIIFIIIYFINSLLKNDLSAKDILDKKYANGEISEQEYQVKKTALQS